MCTFFSALVSAVIFSFLGVGVFGGSFWLIDRFTPYSLWQEIVEKANVAVAILAGSIALAIGLIVSSAIHG